MLQTDDRQTDGRTIAYSEREREFTVTFAKNMLHNLRRHSLNRRRLLNHKPGKCQGICAKDVDFSDILSMLRPMRCICILAIKMLVVTNGCWPLVSCEKPSSYFYL